MPVWFCDIKFRKVGEPDDDGCCVYQVVDRDDGKLYGWVFSHIRASYPGDGGPKEWIWSTHGCDYRDREGVPERTRTKAAQRLLERIN